MRANRIHNIVFYKFYDKGREIKKACIFFRDGTIKDTTFEEGLDACELIVQARGITSKNAFEEMINREIVHVMSAEDLVKNYANFQSHIILDREMVQESIDDKMASVEASEKAPTVEKANIREQENHYVGKHAKKTPVVVAPVTPVAADPIEEEDDVLDVEEEKAQVASAPVTPTVEVINPKKEETEEKKPGFFKRHWKKLVAVTVAILMGLGLYSCGKHQTLEGAMFRSNLTSSGDNILGNEDELPIVNDETEEDVIDVTATETLNQPTQTPSTTTAPEVGDTTVEQFYDSTTNSVLIRGNNEYYNGYTYEQLLQVTQNATQKRAMTNLHDALFGFNGPFADAYVEEGKDVRAALSFDEVVALQQAYNDYSIDQIRAIFNGEEVNASKMSMNYKSATLQLMGAHVLEDSEHPVDMSMLLETEEGRAFYQRYHELFLACKETTGDEQIANVKKFSDAVRQDFPITEQVRTQGISHADSYGIIDENYKYSVVPMVAAFEKLFQNLMVENDFTLNDMEIDWINDIGVCNVVDNKYKRIETIMLSSYLEDITNPELRQYREAMEKVLKERKQYGLADGLRELTLLDRYLFEIDRQNRINPLGPDGTWSYEGTTTTTTTTHQEVETWTETHTDTHTETEIIHAPIPDEERERIDQELEDENEAARRAAEEAARREAERLQREADEHAQQVQQEVEQDQQDMQDRIDDANQQIDQNHDSDPSNDKPVNESDFGDHNVDFHDEHEDGHGNLNDSVENITTDGTGASKPSDPLPDPNETGAAFDAQADYNIPTEIVIESNSASSSRSATQETHQEAPKQETHQEAPKQETHQEAPAQETHQEAPKQETHQEAPKQETHQEAPKQETHQEAPKQETHQEAPKQEEHHEAPKKEEHHEAPKQETHHDEPVYTPVEVPREIVVDENTSIEIPAPKGSSAKSNEQIVDEYLDSLEHSAYVDEEAYQK